MLTSSDNRADENGVIALWKNPSHAARRKSNPAVPVELSEGRLEKVIKALSLAPRAAGLDRPSPRLSLSAAVTVLPFRHGRSEKARPASIHDISSAGVSVLAAEAMPVGTQFKLLIPRRLRRAIEVLCTVRHCRASEEGFIMGAEYGVSWIETLGTLVGPPPVAAGAVARARTLSELAIA